MAVVQTVPLSGRCSAPLLAAAVATASLLMGGGCSTTQEFFSRAHSAAPPAPCQIACTWQNSVKFVPDPARNGVPAPGLVGRMYIFGPDIGHPMEGDGGLIVDLYDETHGGEPKMVERWEFDPTTLKRLVKADIIGTGYTLFLPWGRYSPDMTKVRLRARYQPPKGAPLFTENAVTLAPQNGIVQKGAAPIAYPPMPHPSLPPASVQQQSGVKREVLTRVR